MWRNKKKLILITVSVYAVLSIWNAVNISVSKGLIGEKKQVLRDEEEIKKVILVEGELPKDMLYVDKAIAIQKRKKRQLEKNLVKEFQESLFSIPKEFKPSKAESPKIFFNAKSDDIKTELVKKSSMHNFSINTDLRFGDADANTIHESVSRLYLIQRILHEAVNSGLSSLESINQKPKELVRTDNSGFEFEIFKVAMSFTGAPGNIFSFIDSFQSQEGKAKKKQKVFVENIIVEATERAAAASMDFSIVTFKGRSEKTRRSGLKRKESAGKQRTREKKKKKTDGMPLGI